MPLYYRGAKQYRNRGDYNGKYQPLQLYRRAAADDNRNPTVQQPVLVDAVLGAAERTGGETSRIFRTATQHPSGAAIRKIHSHDPDGQFSGTDLGLLRLVGMAVFPDTSPGRHTP